MATASVGRRCRGRARSQGGLESQRRAENVPPKIFGADIDGNIPFGVNKSPVATSSSDEDASDESKGSASVNPIDSEERKKKLDQLVYKYMAPMLITALQEHRLDQILKKYLTLNDDQDAPPAAPPPSSSDSSIDGAKQVASDQPSTISESSGRPVPVCEIMSNIQPSSVVVIEETAVNPKVVQDIIPDPTERQVPKSRGRGYRNNTNERIQGRGVRFH